MHRALTCVRGAETGSDGQNPSSIYRGRKKALSPDQASELQKRAGAGEQKTSLASEFGISRETLYQYLKTNS